MPAFLRSELPVLASSRHHWIVMLRRPHWLLLLALALMFVAAVVDPYPWLIVLLLVLGAFGFLRWQTWRAEWIILTRRRIVRVRGVPETTSAEASLRLDRIAGAILEQTVPGKLLGYGTIELEAAGQHPDVRKLVRVAHPNEFYLEVRKVIFGDRAEPDPSDQPIDYATTPLPPLPPGLDPRH